MELCIDCQAGEGCSGLIEAGSGKSGDTSWRHRGVQRDFKPCPAYSEKSVGFEPPIEILEDLLCRRLSGVDLLQLRYQTKLLPPSVIKEALAERVIDFERRTARPPARGEKRELKEEVYSELLPKALLKSDRIRAFYIQSERVKMCNILSH